MAITNKSVFDKYINKCLDYALSEKRAEECDDWYVDELCGHIIEKLGLPFKSIHRIVDFLTSTKYKIECYFDSYLESDLYPNDIRKNIENNLKYLCLEVLSNKIYQIVENDSCPYCENGIVEVISCIDCNGKGRGKCYACNQFIDNVCKTCEGEGVIEIKCEHCNGHGEKYYWIIID